MLRDIVTGYQEGGADYIYALLTGYGEAAALQRDDSKLADWPMSGDKRDLSAAPDRQGATASRRLQRCGRHELQRRSRAPDRHGAAARGRLVKYRTARRRRSACADVAAFLAWAADPKLEERKRIGWHASCSILLITALLLYIAKKRIWANIAH